MFLYLGLQHPYNGDKNALRRPLVPEIPKSGVDRSKFEANAQHVGGQRDAANRKSVNPSAQEAADIAAQRDTDDHVEIAERGQEASQHTGSSQDLANQARRLNAKRSAMESGEVKPGQVAPGEGPEPQAAAAEPEVNPQAAAAVADPVQGAPGEVPPGTVPPGSVPPGSVPPGSVPPGDPGGSRTDYATRAKAQQDDAQQANMIFQTMAADRQKWMMELWKIWQDTQTKIFEIMQSVVLHRAQVQDKMAEKWAAVLGGYAA
jgi:hypothetical protein